MFYFVIPSSLFLWICGL